ncbi:MAG: hypothetical protein KDN18_16860 [Verrucomicrobiae bacterium]|nr:hypothetical protein [Verrucomicrobiae bacterium]
MNAIQKFPKATPAIPSEDTSSSKAQELLLSWTDGTLANLGEGAGALDAFSRHLSQLYQLPLEACHLISIAVTNAAVGPGVCLAGPGFNSTVPALNTILISERGTKLQLAIEDAFYAIRPYANRLAIVSQTLTEKSVDSVKQRASDLLAQAELALSRAAKTRSPDNPNLKSSDSDWCDPNWKPRRMGDETQEEKNEREASDLERKAAALREEATKVISGYHFHDKPGFFVEGVLPEELIASHDLCADGSIFNLDIDANTWMSMARLSPAKSRTVGSRFNAAWRASTVARKGEILPASTISSLSRMSFHDFTGFWTHPRIEENRLRSIILPANADFAGTFPDHTCTENGKILQFYERSRKLLFQRIEGKKREDIRLSEEAADLFLSFVDEIENALASHPGIRELLQSAGSMTLRQSLLLHLGNGGGKILTFDTMKHACHLTAWSVCGTAGMLENNQYRKQGGQSDSDHDVWVMVAKVKQKGPLSRRELCRTFHDQASSRHLPVIEKALSKGLLLEADDGSLYAPENSGS